MIIPIRNTSRLLLATLCLSVVCTLDFLIPPDVAVGILYVFVVLLLIQESKKMIILFLMLSMLSNTVNFIYFAITISHTGRLHFSPLTDVYLFNSVIVLFGLCVATHIILAYNALFVDLKEERQKIKS